MERCLVVLLCTTGGMGRFSRGLLVSSDLSLILSLDLSRDLSSRRLSRDMGLSLALRSLDLDLSLFSLDLDRTLMFSRDLERALLSLDRRLVDDEVFLGAGDRDLLRLLLSLLFLSIFFLATGSSLSSPRTGFELLTGDVFSRFITTFVFFLPESLSLLLLLSLESESELDEDDEDEEELLLLLLLVLAFRFLFLSLIFSLSECLFFLLFELSSGFLAGTSTSTTFSDSSLCLLTSTTLLAIRRATCDAFVSSSESLRSSSSTHLIIQPF